MSEVRRERRVVGRYLLADAIASGGMATIHLGRLLGPVGFARTVAIKRLYPQYAKDPEFVAAFLDEARLAARIQNPHVVQTLDVVATEGELFLVMEYVTGESLAQLQKRMSRRDARMPPRVASAVITHALYGLHAAHEARADDGEPLRIVHRDVSPQNILVGVDGMGRVVDFGIAKAARRSKETEVGRLKGKIAYMSPEQARSEPLDRRSDVFSAGVVLWEVLTGRRLFAGKDAFDVLAQVLEAPVPPPSRLAPDLTPEVDAVVARALARAPQARFATAREMAIALEHVLAPALAREVGEWVQATVGDELARRGAALERLEREASDGSGSAPALVAAESEATAEYQPSVVAQTPAPAPAAAARATTADDPHAAVAEMPAPAPVAATCAATADDPHAAVAEMPARPPPERRQPARTALAGVLAGVVLFVGLIAVAITTRGRRAEPPPEALPAGVASSGVTATAPASPTGLAPPSATTSEAAPPVAVASGPGSASPAPGAPTVTRRQAPAPRPSRSPQRGCDPPYWVDGDGIKHYKKECKLE